MSPRETQARTLRSCGLTYSKIGSILGVTPQRIYQLVNHRTKPYVKQPNKAALRKILKGEAK